MGTISCRAKYHSSSSINSYAHIDHTGYIPVLVKKGFKGKIYCSRATYGLTAILLKDSGAVQEEEAKRAQEYGTSHHATIPLYTEKDAKNSLTFFHPVDYNTVFVLGSLKVTLIQSFHILGSSFIVISDDKETLTFSGDLGRPHQLLMKSPPHLTQTDFLVLESTYGDKAHPQDDAMKELAEAIHTIIAKKGYFNTILCGRTNASSFILSVSIKTKKDDSANAYFLR